MPWLSEAKKDVVSNITESKFMVFLEGVLNSLVVQVLGESKECFVPPMIH